MTRLVVPTPPSSAVKASSATGSSSLYVVAPAKPLPRVDASITLGAALLGRGHDVHFNSRLIDLAKKLDPWLYVISLVGSIGACLLLYSQTPTMGLIASVVASVTFFPIMVTLIMALSRDLVWLIMQTFEFWFLTAMVVGGAVACCAALADQRIWGFVAIAVILETIVFLDAQIHNRRFLFRLTALAPGGVVSGLLACMLRITPRLVVSSVTLGTGHAVDSVDAVLHCYSTLAIFTAAKVYRSRRLLCPSKEPIKEIPCEIYFPCCHLVPTTRPRCATSRRARNDGTCDIELVSRELPGVIDVDDVVWPHPFLFGVCQWVTTTGYIGFLNACVGLFSYISNGCAIPSTTEVALSTTSCLAASICVIFSVTQAQRTLFHRLLRSLDAWFVFLQFLTVTIVVCDVLNWDRRIVFLLSGLLWFVWCLLEDTLTPTTRRRLRFRRPLILLVHTGLLAYPVVLIYWIFYSDTHFLRNRVFFRATVFRSQVKMEAYSMILSRIITVWLWMGRFLWREVFYPRDAFKLFKYRAQYPLSSFAHTSKLSPRVSPNETTPTARPLNV